MFQATRRRLALWYTLVTALLLILFATGVYFYARQTLIERVDDTLKHIVEVVHRSLVIQPLEDRRYRLNVEASFRPNSASIEDDHIDLEWFSPQGVLLWSTLSQPALTLQQAPPSGKTASLGFSPDHLLRQLTERLEENRQVLGYLRVSHPWFEVTKPIRQLLWDLTLGLLVLITTVAATGWFLSGLAMAPIRDSYQSLKQFTADASHELRNPIAVIQTNAQAALAESDLESQQQALRVIERLSQRLGNLVNDLLFLARSDSGTLQTDDQEIPLDALLLAVAEEQQLSARRQGVTLILEIPETAPETSFDLRGDWDQLARLFTNLIANALSHSPPQSQVLLVLEPNPPYWQVRIQDQGAGIAPQDLPRLFERFYRADPARSPSSGAGLGLAIVQAIVQTHQGQIKVKSQPGQGAVFIVLLPQAPVT